MQAKLPRFAIFALLAVSAALPVSAQTALTSVRPATSVALSGIRIGNFGRINDNYYRGAQPQRGDYHDLAALGVKTVINLTNVDARSGEREQVEHAGMKYVQIPMTTHVPPTPEQIRLFLSVVNDAAQQPVFVHCVGGKHRTGVMTAVYRMTADRWSADQAFQEMKHYKFGMDFLHSEFKNFVYQYQPQREPAAAGAVSATVN